MRNDYTTAELAILKKHYPNKSGAELLKLLPGRTKTSINKKASSMGFKKKSALVKGYKGVKKPDDEKVKYVKKEPRISNARKEKAEKKQERTFKNRVVDPGEIIKVRVDHKTELEIPKGKNIEEVVARYHDRQAMALKQLKR